MPFRNQKKNKLSSKNPLSQARGKQQDAAHIWFRKSLAGYRCFVEYYCGQPLPGTTPCDGESDHEDASDSADMVNRNSDDGMVVGAANAAAVGFSIAFARLP